MAVLSLNLADADLQRIVNALCTAGGYDPSLANARKFVADYVRTTVANVEETQWRVSQAALRGPGPVTIS
jgi:hypothetical protein